jgi:hypothetical protein
MAAAPPPTAQQEFTKLYRRGGWRFRPGQPRSGGGSTLVATNTTCAILLHAVRLAAESAPPARPVRILDAPCGDFTWMPSCLRWMAERVPTLRLEYRGIDVVEPLIEQLNRREGGLLSHLSASAFAVPPSVTLLPFERADATNRTEMARYAQRVDVLLSKHMLIHTPNALIERALAAWDSLGAALLVRDDTQLERRRNTDTVVAGGHDVNLHIAPFHVAPPLCAQHDAGLCAAEGKCRDRIEVYRMPLQRMGAGERADAVKLRHDTSNAPPCLDVGVLDGWTLGP